MKSNSMFLVFFMLLFCSVSAGWAATIQVPDDYGKIQVAIWAAVDGDTVLVADGTYTGSRNKNITFEGKAITVMSENGPDVTIIDCENDGRGFNFSSDENADAVLEGFTITKGNADKGGGIVCKNSSPTIVNCVIFENTASKGGGLHMYSSYPILTDCVISGNISSGDGGGIYCYKSYPSIEGSTLTSNTADYGGGIACIIDSGPTITNCTMSDNLADFGGAISCSLSTAFVENCIIMENMATDDGGGLYCSAYSSPIINNCIITSNTADNTGGGCRLNGSTLTITNCSITNNVGGGITNAYSSDLIIANCIVVGNKGIFDEVTVGGGIKCESSSLTLTHCTITDNEAEYGGGLKISDSDATISNGIIWNNSPVEIFVDSSTTTISYSNIKGGWEGEGNIDADPLFLDPDNDDFHLTANSPCIDIGTDASVYEDIEGDVRPWGDGFDMGADEYMEGLVIEVMFYPTWIFPGDLLSWKIRATNIGEDSVDVEPPRFFRRPGYLSPATITGASCS